MMRAEIERKYIQEKNVGEKGKNKREDESWNYCEQNLKYTFPVN